MLHSPFVESLFELGGIQGGIALPGDSIFDRRKCIFDKPSYERLKREFGIDKDEDFIFKGAPNGGLGSVHVYGSYSGAYIVSDKNNHYPNAGLKFSDEGGSNGDGNLLPYIKQEEIGYHPYNSFIAEKGVGLTKAGLGRLNRSIEAYVYCVLGAQVNTRSSIVGDSGSAQETQAEFIVLFESSIIENSITKSIQRYQMAIQQSRVKLDFAISRDCWLLPGKMIINTESVIGYNNKLQKATQDMKFGVNDINSTSRVIKNDNMGGSKTKLPHQVTDHKKDKKQPEKPISPHTVKPIPKSKSHETMLIGVTIGATALATYLFA